MAIPLNDRRIASLPTPTLAQRQIDHWDPSMRGFGVRVSHGGKKAFVVRYRVNGRLRRMTLGPYPDLSLADARRKARMVMGDVAHGDDPAQDKIERRQVLTFSDLGREYTEMAQRRHKRWTEEKRIIEKDLVPVLGHRLLTDDEIRELWSVLEQLTQPANSEPVELSPDPSTKQIRRVITPATAQAFQVQLLTGQRPGEVRDMKMGARRSRSRLVDVASRGHKKRQGAPRAVDRGDGRYPA